MKTLVALPAVSATAAGLQVSERLGVTARDLQPDGAGLAISQQRGSTKRIRFTHRLREMDGLRPALAAPASTPVPWSMYAGGEDAEESRRTEVREAGLRSGRVRFWTTLIARDLWSEWIARFGGDEDLALECAIQSAERVVRSKCPASQQRLFQLKRRLLGYHARGMLDERYERRGIEAVWNTKPWDLPDEDEYRLWPLPWKGLIAIIKPIVVKRRRVRPCDL